MAMAHAAKHSTAHTDAASTTIGPGHPESILTVTYSHKQPANMHCPEGFSEASLHHCLPITLQHLLISAASV